MKTRRHPTNPNWLKRKGAAIRLVAITGLIAVTTAACISRPPVSQDNICEIYRQKPGWYKDSVKAARYWKSNLHVPMAIMRQESAFRARAKPPMRYFLGFIPYGRASNAYGYAQALDSTWAQYRREAGNLLSQRNKFDDAIDFIQWYMHKTALANKVAKTDAYNQYLNYHEGQGGFARGSYKNKRWLLNVASRVERRAANYRAQLASCKAELDQRASRWSLFN
ncbi:MAG: hypothetical protein AAF402_12840 [Pseudomonadota bacterium]